MIVIKKKELSTYFMDMLSQIIAIKAIKILKGTP
jgi:hypothetical protein